MRNGFRLPPPSNGSLKPARSARQPKYAIIPHPQNLHPSHAHLHPHAQTPHSTHPRIPVAAASARLRMAVAGRVFARFVEARRTRALHHHQRNPSWRMAADAVWRSQFSGCPVVCANRPAVPTPAHAVGSRCLFCRALCQRVLHQPWAARQRHGGLSLFGAALWAQRGADFDWLGGLAAHCSFYRQPIAAVRRYWAGYVGLRRCPSPSHSCRLVDCPCQRVFDARRGHHRRRRPVAHRLAALVYQRAMAHPPHSHHPNLRHAHRPAACQHPPHRPCHHPPRRV